MQKSIQNSQILMSLNLFKIKVLEISCWKKQKNKLGLISDKVTLGVGLHSGYGPAQRLYIKRGYIPDGTGVWYQNHQPAMNAVCEDIGELVLYLSKNLF